MPTTATILDLAHIAAAGSADEGATDLLPPGFAPVSAAELGFVPGPGQSFRNGTYRNDNAQAFVAKGVVDGQETLVLAFSGSDDREDKLFDIVGINQNYPDYLPLVDAVDAAMAEGRFDRLIVTGTSLGGAMTQLYMATHPDPDIRAVTFGSPGAEIADAPDPRIVNVVNLDDRSIWLGENRGSLGALAAANAALLEALAQDGSLPAGLDGRQAVALLSSLDSDYVNRGTTLYLPREDGGSDPIGGIVEAARIGNVGHSIFVYAARLAAALDVAQGQAPEPVVAVVSPNGRPGLIAFDAGGNVERVEPLSGPGAGWTLAGLGDATGDGGTDLFFTHRDGRLTLLETRDGAVVDRGPVGRPQPGWELAGIGDIDGDARSDAIWRDAEGGVQVWRLQGESVVGMLDLGRRPLGWTIEATCDFDGDGRADLLWQNAGGRVEAWLLDGVGGTEKVAIGRAAAGERFAATGDLNGDGRSDILWQDDAGAVTLWEIGPGGALASVRAVGSLGPGGRVEGTRDVSRDGRDDVIARTADGDLVVWLMDGADIVGGGVAGSLSTDWQIVA